MLDILCLVTARGGSKSIPQKNIASLAGKPLIAWTIETALQSAMLRRVIVSTDDEEIAEVARQWGAEVPFVRPLDLALDDSPHIPVVLHAIQWLESNEDVRFQYVLLLQPTSPLRSKDDIDKAIELALDKEADSVVSVCQALSHPYLTKRITGDGRLKDFGRRPQGYLRRQALPDAYMVNGAIYVVQSETLINRHTLYTENTYAYVMPPERSLDIDTHWDLYLADLILRDRVGGENN
jgi:CMP-N-acetylneuraminic acid synthetase